MNGNGAKKPVARKGAAADPLSTLAWHYTHPRDAALAAHRRGERVVGITSNMVPWELIQAAGAYPTLVTAAHEETPLADPYMEPVFDRRIRSIFEDVLAGRWAFLRALITPRTSEWEHKLFLYLLEVRRQSPAARRRLPVPWLYDLLQTRSPEAARYGLDRTRALLKALETLTGRTVTRKSLGKAVQDGNRWRAVVRGMLRLRRGRRPRLRGAEALTIVGAGFVMPRDEHTRLVAQLLPSLAIRPFLPGPRIMVKGSPLDHVGLHDAIERHGAIVVAEDDWWGSRSAGRDVASGDPLLAIFRKYYGDSPNARVFPAKAADAWFEREVRHGIDAVVYYLPPDDDVLGWDYPRHRAFLEAKGIPVMLVREDARHLTASTLEELAGFLRRVPEPRR